jgi:hypothetical protein
VAERAAAGDESFAELQARGQQAMGVDQYTSTHLFDALPDGGRIELQRDADDPAGVTRIRQHLQGIARAFQIGDFSTPAFVHMQDVPGTAVMAAKRSAITYTYRELPAGGEVRIETQDAEAIKAIHAFMAFQREDHRAGGATHDHGTADPGAMDHAAHMAGGMAGGGRMSQHVMGGGMTGSGPTIAMRGDSAFTADMSLVHELLAAHNSIERTVTHLPNGVRAVTESSDSKVAAYIRAHVASMEQRMLAGEVFNVASPTIPILFANADRIQTVIQQTPRGIIFTQTTDDPELTPVLQAHAAEVTELVRDGMAAMMRSMMQGRGDGSTRR